jgi:hypothetical protein
MSMSLLTKSLHRGQLFFTSVVKNRFQFSNNKKRPISSTLTLKEAVMKNREAMLPALAVLIIASLLIASPGFAEPEFCWRDTETRGVGKIPSACQEGRERIGLLCYSKCGTNMQRAGFDCHSTCPAGMRDDGLFCRAAEYGRGEGYPWKFGDPPFNYEPALHRCEADHGHGSCERSGLIYYPTCKHGDSPVGCCICRPGTPDCGRLGLNPGVDLSCAKKIVVGDPVTGVCAAGEQADAGLCYPACKPGFKGVGPVCWGGAPSGWVECGMGAAKDAKTCESIVLNQVASVGKLAMTIATLGESSAVTSAASAPAKASRLAQLKDLYGKMKTAYETAKKEFPALQKAEQSFQAGGNTASKDKKAAAALTEASEAVTEEDLVRAAAEIASIVDSSGVSATIDAYTYPKCSKYFGGR